ncbi:MAG TPA: YfhO family protein [Chitinispirillaceae bacterium]|nr:YfhO family protein [Chitinispirillaceae bacterium]
MAKKKKPVAAPEQKTEPGKKVEYGKYLPLSLIIFFLIFYGKFLIGSAALWEDVVEQAYPNLMFTLHSIKKGLFPFWTPYVFSGMPFFADVQANILYPPYWILLLLSLFTSSHTLLLSSFIVVHILWLGVGVYLLSIHFGFRRISALFTAVALMFTGYVSLHVIHFIYIYVISWFPLTLLFLDKSFKTGNLRYCLISGLFFGISTFGGYPQANLHFACVLAGWTALAIVRNWGSSWTARLLYASYYALVMAIGLGLAAAQYLLSVELMQQSVRQTLDFEQASLGSIPLRNLLTFIAPKFFGSVSGSSMGQSFYWGFPQSFLFWETNAFVGIITLFLAVRAIFDTRKNPVIIFLLIAASLTLILSLGNNTPLWYLVFNYVPGFSNFRLPGRFISWFSYMVVFLAGIGLDLILKNSTDPKVNRNYFKAVAIIAGVTAFGLILFLTGAFRTSEYFQHETVLKNSINAAGFALLSIAVSVALIWAILFRKNKSAWGMAMVVFTFVELYAFGGSFAGSKVTFEQFYKNDISRPLKEKLKEESFRVQSRLYRGPGKGQMILPRNLGNVYELPLTEGYNQFLLKRYSDLLNHVNDTVSQELLNVKYKKVPGRPVFYELKTMPRFYCSPFVKVVDNHDSALAYLNSTSFTPGRDIILEEVPESVTDTLNGAVFNVKLLRETANVIELEVNAQGNTFLSAGEIYYPSWKVTVDGKKSRLYAANLAFRAVPIEKGTHRVVMRFESDFFRVGMAVSVIILLILLTLIFFWDRIPLPTRLKQPWAGMVR